MCEVLLDFEAAGQVVSRVSGLRVRCVYIPGSETSGGVSYWRDQGHPRQLLETPWGLSCGGSWIPVEISSFAQFAQTSGFYSIFLYCIIPRLHVSKYKLNA